MPRTEEGEVLATIVQGGGPTGFSFGLLLGKSDYVQETAGVRARYFKRLAISEISLLLAPSVPAYPLVGKINWKRKR